MSKEVFNSTSSVGIVYLRSNPAQVLIEMKDDGYPRKVFARAGCIIGGN